MTNMFDHFADAKMRVYFEMTKEKRIFLFEELFRSRVQKKRSLPTPLPYFFIKLVLFIKN